MHLHNHAATAIASEPDSVMEYHVKEHGQCT